MFNFLQKNIAKPLPAKARVQSVKRERKDFGPLKIILRGHKNAEEKATTIDVNITKKVVENVTITIPALTPNTTHSRGYGSASFNRPSTEAIAAQRRIHNDSDSDDVPVNVLIDGPEILKIELIINLFLNLSD